MPPLKNYPFTSAPARDHQGPKLFNTTELPGDSHIPKQYPPITGRLITWVNVQHWSPCLIVHKTEKYETRRLLKFNWRIMLVRLAKMKLPPSFWVNSFAEKFCCGKAGAITGQSDHKVSSGARHSSTDTWNPVQPFYLTLGNIHHIYHQSTLCSYWKSSVSVPCSLGSICDLIDQ